MLCRHRAAIVSSLRCTSNCPDRSRSRYQSQQHRATSVRRWPPSRNIEIRTSAPHSPDSNRVKPSKLGSVQTYTRRRLPRPKGTGLETRPGAEIRHKVGVKGEEKKGEPSGFPPQKRSRQRYSQITAFWQPERRVSRSPLGRPWSPDSGRLFVDCVGSVRPRRGPSARAYWPAGQW